MGSSPEPDSRHVVENQSNSTPGIAKMSNQAFKAELSVVLQGPLWDWNYVLIANLCCHWRKLFPDSPLILSLSQTDLVEYAGPGALASPKLVSRHRTNATMRSAMTLIWSACDEVVIAAPALPLPPVKAGLGDNHVNLQIAAAQAGLERVTTQYVLRIRHDMSFVDDSLINFYLSNRVLPRGSDAVFAERILISPLFTLNPLTLERLPYHYSDWFNLGLTRDVRALWTVEPMSMSDATYYKRNNMSPDSNVRERSFIARFAAEQHIVRSAFSRLGMQLALDYHNDPADRERSLRVLSDNFILADLDITKVIFDKYEHVAAAHDIALVCVTHQDWRALAQSAEGNVADVFRAKIVAARSLLGRELAASRSLNKLPFWRRVARVWKAIQRRTRRLT
jgi:hypothetical protein